MASISKSSAAFRSVRTLLQQQQTDESPRNHHYASEARGGRDGSGSRKRESERATDSQSDSWARNIPSDLYDLSEGSAGSCLSIIKILFAKFEQDPCSAGKMAVEIDKIIRSSPNLDDEEWDQIIAKFLVPLTCTHGSPYTEILLILNTKLIDLPEFQKVMFQTLVSRVNKLLNPETANDVDDDESKNLCRLMGSLAITKWPMAYASCAKECNAVLYSVLNLIHSWIKLIEKSSQRRSMPRNPAASCESCVCALMHLCNHCGRKLWLKWPELVDKMYAALRIAVVAPEIPLKLETKYKLLDLYVQINEWPKKQDAWRKKADGVTVTTQTIQTSRIHLGTDDLYDDLSGRLAAIAVGSQPWQ